MPAAAGVPASVPLRPIVLLAQTILAVDNFGGLPRDRLDARPDRAVELALPLPVPTTIIWFEPDLVSACQECPSAQECDFDSRPQDCSELRCSALAEFAPELVEGACQVRGGNPCGPGDPRPKALARSGERVARNSTSSANWANWASCASLANCSSGDDSGCPIASRRTRRAAAQLHPVVRNAPGSTCAFARHAAKHFAPRRASQPRAKRYSAQSL